MPVFEVLNWPVGLQFQAVSQKNPFESSAGLANSLVPQFEQNARPLLAPLSAILLKKDNLPLTKLN